MAVTFTRINPYAAACLSRSLIELLGAKWTILVVGCLTDGTRRFSELSKLIDGITAKELTRTLRQLERSGLVIRTVHPVVPPRVDYELSALGKTLRDPIEAILEWTDGHIDECLEAQERFDAVT